MRSYWLVWGMNWFYIARKKKKKKTRRSWQSSRCQMKQVWARVTNEGIPQKCCRYNNLSLHPTSKLSRLSSASSHGLLCDWCTKFFFFFSLWRETWGRGTAHVTLPVSFREEKKNNNTRVDAIIEKGKQRENDCRSVQFRCRVDLLSSRAVKIWERKKSQGKLYTEKDSVGDLYTVC